MPTTPEDFEDELTLELAPPSPRSPLQSLLDRNRLRLRRELHSLGASNIRVFGSAARGEDNQQSDVDILVDLDESVGLFTLGRMRTAAEAILGVSVDVVPAGSLKADVRERVLAEAVAL